MLPSFPALASASVQSPSASFTLLGEEPNVELCGRNIETVRRIMNTYAEALLRGDESMPANILLLGVQELEKPTWRC